MTKLLRLCLLTVCGTGMLTLWSCAHPATLKSSLGRTRSTSLTALGSPSRNNGFNQDRGTPRPASEADRQKVQRSYGNLPLSFEANQGQTDERVEFLARGDGYSMFLTPTEAVLALRGPVEPGSAGVQPVPGESNGAPQPNRGSVLRMTLLGGNPTPPATGLEELPGKSHYFVGNDPKQWRTDVPNYGKVRFADVYPGVDLVYYGNQRQLEYDFVVAPGADPSAIRLAFAGAERLEIDAQGELALQTPAGEVRLRKPVVYQEVDGIRQIVDGHYVRKGKAAVGFAVAPFNAHLPLVIDPVLVYSTYLAGSLGADAASIAVDSWGSAYVTGNTGSANFPTTSGAFMPQLVWAGDAFVTKMDPAGNALVYSTYLGGNGNSESGRGIAVDAWGNAYLTGWTNSTNFPTTLNAFRSTSGGGVDAFVTKLDPAGSALLYSTYLGGSGDDRGFGVAADSSGHAYVTGFTGSANFPTLNALQTTLSGTRDAFVTKLDTNLAGVASLVYSTYLGGSLEEDGFGNTNHSGDIAADSSGNVYVTGSTDSADFPTSNAFQTALLGIFNPNFNAFVTKLDTNLSGPASLIYSTYFGTGGSEFGTAIAVDSAGSAYVTGFAWSVPTTAGAFQVSPRSNTDAFVTKLTPDGGGLVYSTYLGGSGPETGWGIAVDFSGHAHVTGYTSSTNFPISNAVQASSGGGYDAYVTKLTPDGSGLVYSTYLGGSGDDFGLGIATDAWGAAYLTGGTISTNFPVANPFQAQGCCLTRGSAFVSKIAENTAPTISIGDVTAMEGNAGPTPFAFTVTLSMPGTLPITVDFATADGTATAGADYVSTSGPLTFNPGQTSQTVVATVAADTVVEADETFSVRLLNPRNALLARGTGIGTILDDDGGPRVQLIVSKTGSGAGTVTSSPAGIDCGAQCSTSLPSGTQVTLTAVAAAGSTFDGWAGACSGTSACTVTLTATTAVTAAFSRQVAPPNPRMHLDFPIHGTTLGQPFLIGGWAVDLGAASGTGVSTVHVYAYPLVGGLPDANGVVFLGVAVPGARPDVTSAYGWSAQFLNSGFTLVPMVGLPAGQWQVVAYALSTVTGTWQAQAAVITIPTPIALVTIDTPAASATVGQPFLLAGWAIDLASPTTVGISAVHVWAYPASGAPIWLGVVPVTGPRADVAAYYGTHYLYSGWGLNASGLQPGTYSIAVTPLSAGNEVLYSGAVVRVVTVQ